MAYLSPSAIFSPSVARQQLATAKDWNYIDGWLTTKFNGKSAPPFERNNDTLKALLALATLNENADEESELLSKVEAKTIQELQSKEVTGPEREPLQAIEDHLTREGHVSLDTIPTAAVLLDQPLADTEQLARKILELQITSLNLDQANDRVAILHKHLKTELDQINALVEELHSEAYQPSPELSKQILDHQHKAKMLAAKLPELKNRITSLSAGLGAPKPTIQDVKVEEEKFSALLATVKDLEAQSKVFHGLPHDTDLARLELESVRVELRDLTRQRDAIFEGLVEKESPKKHRS